MRKLVVAVGLFLVIGSARAQFCPGASPYVFDDVLASDSLCPDITWMALNNITSGCASLGGVNLNYCPDLGVTRKQMAKFMFQLGKIRVQEVDTAAGLTGGPITQTGTIGLAATQLLPTTACANGQVPQWNGSGWTCATLSGTGTVTSVAGGIGIVASPSPIIGTGTLNLAPAYQLPQGCSNGQLAKSNGAGGWTCATDSNSGGTVTSVATGTGIVGGPITAAGTVSLDPKYQLPQPAGNNQTLRYDAVGSGSWIANPSFLARQDGGVLMTGTFGSGIAPASGAGGRTMWYPGKASFRAGYVTSNQWDDGNIGVESIGLGYNTVASGLNSTSIGGSSTANGQSATTIGWNNIASGSYATAIGNSNTAAANNSIAMGQQASTSSGQAGSFVFADSQNFGFNSPISNEFAVRATGGARFVTDIDVSGNPQRTVAVKPGGILDFGANTRQMINLWNANYGIGVQSSTTYFRSDANFCWFVGGVHSDAACDSGGGGYAMSLFTGDGGHGNSAPYTLFVPGNVDTENFGSMYAHDFIKSSDRTLKTAFQPVEAREVLSRVARLPVSTWVFKNDPATRHIGPMAQDFYAAFGMGADDKHIGSLDAEGVALAAIQGLYAELKDRDVTIAEQQQEIAEQQREIADERREIGQLRERLVQVESLRGELAALRNAITAATRGETVAAQVGARAR